MEDTPEQRQKFLDADAGGGSDGEDRLGALPDDLLIHILLKLEDVAAPARTSVLARRWRGLWTLLPELHFVGGTNPHGIGHAIAAHEAPVLRHLSVVAWDASPGSVAAWLPVAARRLSGDLFFVNIADKASAAAEGCAFELPCCENAVAIVLDLDSLGLALPPSGVFARLVCLSLLGVRLHGPCLLGDAVSSPRCPSLQTLAVSDSMGVGNLAIHSDSLQEVELSELPDMLRLTVVAPALKELKVAFCFADAPNPNQPVANISAPRLLSLVWMNAYDPSSVHLGEMTHLQWLAPEFVLVYGPDSAVAHTLIRSRLLQHFQRLDGLFLTLVYPPDGMRDWKYLLGNITRIPHISSLTLSVLAREHSFGASSFHFLRMCSTIARLRLRLTGEHKLEEKIMCPTDCICDQPPNWKTDELRLNCLEEVEISGLRGTEHEVAVVKCLFNWAKVLKRMTVHFDDSVVESKGKDLSQLFLSFSRPEICVEFNMFVPDED